MADEIKDGTGTGNRAKVDNENRIWTRAITTDLATESALAGNGFVILSGALTLTTANESALLYFKNNSDRDMIINKVITQAGAVAGPSTTDNDFTFSAYVNATGMTGGGAADSGVFQNARVGDITTYSHTKVAGAEGATLDGITFGTTLPFRTGIFQRKLGQLEVDDIIPPGQSFSLSCTPPAGTTSATVFMGWLVSFVDRNTIVSRN